MNKHVARASVEIVAIATAGRCSHDGLSTYDRPLPKERSQVGIGAGKGRIRVGGVLPSARRLQEANAR